MVEAISLSPHYITATALATKPCTPSSRWLRKRKRGFLATHDTAHTSCLLQYSTKLSQSRKEALKIANRTRLTNTAWMRLGGWLLSFYIFSIFNHCSFDFLGGSPSCLLLWQASLESVEDLCFVTFVQKNDGLSDGEHGQPSGIRGAFL